MANFKYFLDIDGQTYEFDSACYYGCNDLRVRHPKTGEYVKITRTVIYKTRPSLHTCDARCLHAKGKTMNCECSCGGKNHGKGAA